MKSKLSENLKAFREKIGLKQVEIADLVGITDKNWSSYERGVTEPNIVTLAKIAKIFGISVDNLITMDAMVISQSSIDPKFNIESLTLKTELGEPVEKYRFVPRVVTLGNQSQGNDNVVMVSIQARAGYLAGYGDPEFIQSLPSYRFPGLAHGTFRMFELQGQSMVPTFYESDVVVGRFVESLAEVRDDRVYVALTKQHGIVIGRAINRSHTGSKLILKSDNQQSPEEYPLYVFDRDDIVEIWYVTQYLSRHVRKPGELYARMIDLESRLTLMEERERKRLKK